MPELIVYSDIAQKNEIERKMFKALSPMESLIHTLNMMDLYAAMNSHRKDDDGIDWIILEFKDDIKQ